MTRVELIVTQVLRVPDVIGSILQIWSAFADGMLIEAIETRLVDNVEDGLFGIRDSNRRVGCSYLAIGLYAKHRAEVDAFLGIASSVTRHRQLRGDGLNLVGHLSREGNATIDVALHADGDEFIGVRSEVLAFDGLSVARVPIFYNSRVEAETAMVAADGTKT